MCLTLNSATECAGSRFQVVTVPGAEVVVGILNLLLSLALIHFFGWGCEIFVVTSVFGEQCAVLGTHARSRSVAARRARPWATEVNSLPARMRCSPKRVE